MLANAISNSNYEGHAESPGKNVGKIQYEIIEFLIHPRLSRSTCPSPLCILDTVREASGSPGRTIQYRGIKVIFQLH